MGQIRPSPLGHKTLTKPLARCPFPPPTPQVGRDPEAAERRCHGDLVQPRPMLPARYSRQLLQPRRRGERHRERAHDACLLLDHPALTAERTVTSRRHVLVDGCVVQTGSAQFRVSIMQQLGQ